MTFDMSLHTLPRVVCRTSFPVECAEDGGRGESQFPADAAIDNTVGCRPQATSSRRSICEALGKLVSLRDLVVRCCAFAI